jgi:O-antigen/teichoic acid export membrane protein
MTSLSRSVLSGTALLSFSGIAGRSLSFISAPILTALLAPTAYGAAAYVQTLASVGAVIALFGIDMAYARYYFDLQAGKPEEIERFCWRVSLGGCAIVSVLLYLAWRFVVAKHFGVPPGLGLFVAAGVAISVVYTMTQTRARLRGGYRRMAVSSLVGAVLGVTTSILIAWLWRRDEWAILIGAIAGVLISVLMLGMPGFSSLSISSKIETAKRREVILLGLAGAVTAPMYWLISSSDRWFLGYYRDQSQVGIYSVAFSVAGLGLMLNSAITQVWIPEAMRVHQTNPQTAPQQLGELWERLVAGLLLMWLAVASAGGDVLRLMTHANYHSGAGAIPLLAAGVTFYGISSLSNTGLLIGNRMNYAAYLWAAGGIFSLILNHALVPGHGMLGAALTQCLTYLAIACATTILSWRVFPLGIQWLKLGAIVTAVFLIGSVMTFAWNGSPITSLALKFPVGLITSFLVFRFIAPSWTDAALKIFKSVASPA